jgi:hypothetical protein
VALPILLKRRALTWDDAGRAGPQTGVISQKIHKRERSGTNPTISSLKKVLLASMGEKLEREAAWGKE